jgi:hypothetical protein
MAIMLMLVLRSPASNMSANKHKNGTNFPELKEGEHYGTCEERSVGLVCNIEHE